MAYSRRRLQGRGIFYVFKLSSQDFGPERHQRIIVMFLQKHTMSRRTLFRIHHHCCQSMSPILE